MSPDKKFNVFIKHQTMFTREKKIQKLSLVNLELLFYVLTQLINLLTNKKYQNHLLQTLKTR